MNRLTSAAAQRNEEVILEQLRQVLPEHGIVLEIASGTGQHALAFSRALSPLRWQPSDPDPMHRASIDAWRDEQGLDNLLAALELDVTSNSWPVQKVDAVVNINMIHIAPLEVTEALFRGAHRVLTAGGVLFMYGPYQINGEHTAPSNAAFHASLQERDPSWGVRDLADVKAVAFKAGFAFEKSVAMPANNFAVVYRRC